jgi:hypothetical protein
MTAPPPWFVRTVVQAAVALGILAWLAAAQAADAGQGTPPAPVEVAVDLAEWAVTVDRPSVPAGVPVRLLVTNRGTFTHALSIGEAGPRTADLAPGERATLEVVFGEAEPMALFCPLGRASHRRRGEETTLAVVPGLAGHDLPPTPAPPPPATAPLTAPGAEVDRVGLPEDYRERFRPFLVVDRLEKQQEGIHGSDVQEVRAIYQDPTSAQARTGEPLPYGSVLVAEFYAAKTTEDGQPARDAAGRLLRGDLLQIGVMRKEPGFGVKYGPDRTGEWEYVMYRPDGGYATPPQLSQSCPQCHVALTDAAQDWVVWRQPSPEQQRVLERGLAAPHVGVEGPNGLLGLLPMGLLAGAPLFLLGWLALRSVARA